MKRKKTHQPQIIESMIDEVERYWLTHLFDAISCQGAYTEELIDIYKFSRGNKALIPSMKEDRNTFKKSLETISGVAILGSVLVWL